MIQRGRREARPLPSAVAQCRSAVAQCRSERGLHVDDVACEVGRKTKTDTSKYIEKLWGFGGDISTGEPEIFS